MGGTWRENSYPGIACDVPSNLYNYSFEPNSDWTHQYSPGAEIQAYFEGVAEKYGIDKEIRFGDEVVRCEFSDGWWRLETKQGRRDTVDIVIAATGVQITTALSGRSEELCLFQRTAQWMLPQDNPAYTAEQKSEFHDEPEHLRELHDNLSKLFAEGFANIRQLIDLARSGDCRHLCASAEATEAFDAARVEAAKKTIWTTGCRSWYLDDRGIPATWPWTFGRFREEMAGPDLDAYERTS